MMPGDPNFNAQDHAPRVAIPERRWVLPSAFAVAGLLGALTFLMLSQGRERAETERLTDPTPGATIAGTDSIPPPPVVAAPPTAPPVIAAPPPVLEATPPLVLAAPPPPGVEAASREARLKAPSLVVDLSRTAETPAGAASAPIAAAPSTQDIVGALGGARPAAGAGADALSSDERFAQRFGVSGEGAVRATRMAAPAHTVPEGTIIAGVLETAINSDLPGFARAVVSRDVRSFDGSRILIPRGSRLVGQYRSGVALGQSRAFIIWTRLVRPDGVSVALGAPAADELGRGGLEGRVDRHFIERFGGAILLSLISAVGASSNDDTNVVIASTRAGGDAASIALQSEVNRPPTIQVPQGAPVRIFVSRDLDFSGVR